MHDITHLYGLYQRARSLASLEPGHGYDDIGREICDLVIKPRKLVESEEILRALEQKESGLIQNMQRISVESELHHEEHMARAFLNRADAAADDLIKEYAYGTYFTRRAGLESECLSQVRNPCVFYVGPSTVPFSALGLQARTDGLIYFIDGDDRRRSLAAALCARLGLQDRLRIVKEVPKTPKADLAIFMNDPEPETQQAALDKIMAGGCRKFLRVKPHGMVRLLYPDPPSWWYAKLKFIKGFVAPHVMDDLSDKARYRDERLGFLSLEFFEAS